MKIIWELDIDEQTTNDAIESVVNSVFALDDCDMMCFLVDGHVVEMELRNVDDKPVWKIIQSK